ncbi:MAG: hypothetical protein PHE16_00140 [Aliarcobacter sp.]|nr:hypothetical protein [Aliarcobacter sp.]
MFFLREIAKKLGITETRLKRIKYFEKNLIEKKELENLKEFFEKKNTNYGLVKARKIEKILRNLENKVA